MSETEIVTIHVPMTPPSVNRYTRHAKGRHFKSQDALGWEKTFPIFIGSLSVSGKAFAVGICVTLGEGERGDVDNFPKMVLDGLAKCGVFRDKKGNRLSDAHVTKLEVCVDRKTRPQNGFTEVTVRAL